MDAVPVDKATALKFWLYLDDSNNLREQVPDWVGIFWIFSDDFVDNK